MPWKDERENQGGSGGKSMGQAGRTLPKVLLCKSFGNGCTKNAAGDAWRRLIRRVTSGDNKCMNKPPRQGTFTLLVRL